MPGREQGWLWKSGDLTTGEGPPRQALLGDFCQGRERWEGGSVSNVNLDVVLTEVEACGSGPGEATARKGPVMSHYKEWVYPFSLD